MSCSVLVLPALFVIAATLFPSPVVSVSTKNECFASQNMNSSLKNFNYPLDIYDKKLLLEYNSNINDIQRSGQLVHCVAMDHFDWPTVWVSHNCSTFKTCPVKKENTLDAIKSTKSFSDIPSLCQFEKIRQNPKETINVIVLGGSVVLGVQSDGCAAKNACADIEQMHHDCPRCSWASYFGEWMKSSSKAQVNFQNLAGSGVSSAFISDFVSQL